MSTETVLKLGAIQRACSPFLEDSSTTVRVLVDVGYAMIFTPETLNASMENIQRLLCNTSQSQMEMFPAARIEVKR